MNRKSHKTITRLTWLAVILVAILIYAASFWYVKSSFQKASYELSSSEIAGQQKDKIKGTADAIKELEEDVSKIDSYFVGSDDVVSFINLLEQRAEGVSIETTNVSILEEDVDLVYGEVLEISLGVSGDWNDVMNYINLVENLPYNIWITQTNLSLEQGEEEEGEGFFWEADITLRVLKHEN